MSIFRKKLNTGSRVYVSAALIMALTLVNHKQAKAYNSENPDGHFATSTNTVPVNYIFTGVVLGIIVVGMIAVKNANKAINSKLKAQRQQGY